MIRQFISESGIEISIGKNAKGNDYLCRHSDKDEYWLHLQNDPSPHAVVHCHFEDKESLFRAAQFVKQYSKRKYDKRVNVIYCQINNLRLTKTLGLVTIINKPNVIRV